MAQSPRGMQSRPAPALRHSATPRPHRSPRASNRSQLKKIRPIRAIRPSRTTGYFAMRPAADFGFYSRRNFQLSAQNKMCPAQRGIGNAPPHALQAGQTNADSTAAIAARRTNSNRRPSANAIRPDSNAKGERETRNWTFKQKLQI